MNRSTYISHLVVSCLRADLLWVRTVIRMDLEHHGCMSFDGMREVWKFREQLRLARERRRSGWRGSSFTRRVARMLILTRKAQGNASGGSRVQIGEAVVTVLEVRGRYVTLGIEAPPEVRIVRDDAKRVEAA